MRVVGTPPRAARRLALTAAVLVAVGGACATRGLYVDPRAAVCAACDARAATLDVRLLLLGDGGAERSAQPVLELLESAAAERPDRSVAVFLGDNVYPAGVPAPKEARHEERARAERILRQQVSAVRTAGARAIFLPGNHDWNRGRAGGLERVLAQQRWFDTLGDPDVAWLPRDGCPGPAVRDLGTSVRLVLLDTQWLLTGEGRRKSTHGCAWGRPGDRRSYAAPVAAVQVYRALEQVVAGAGERLVVVAAHHPTRSFGSHGGRLSARSWWFPLTRAAPWAWLPLPLLYPAVRYGIARPGQDLGARAYAAMSRRLEAAYRLAPRPPLVAAAGHDHALEVLRSADAKVLQIVSGAAAEAAPVGRGSGTLFKHGARGLVVLDAYADGTADVRVLEPGAPRRPFLLRLRR